VEKTERRGRCKFIRSKEKQERNTKETGVNSMKEKSLLNEVEERGKSDVGGRDKKGLVYSREEAGRRQE
jgi:hypothetical protein